MRDDAPESTVSTCLEVREQRRLRGSPSSIFSIKQIAATADADITRSEPQIRKTKKKKGAGREIPWEIPPNSRAHWLCDCLQGLLQVPTALQPEVRKVALQQFRLRDLSWTTQCMAATCLLGSSAPGLGFRGSACPKSDGAFEACSSCWGSTSKLTVQHWAGENLEATSGLWNGQWGNPHFAIGRARGGRGAPRSRSPEKAQVPGSNLVATSAVSAVQDSTQYARDRGMVTLWELQM